jgi:hypothetical protein
MSYFMPTTVDPVIKIFMVNVYILLFSLIIIIIIIIIII